MSRVIITGGTGMIGRALAKELASTGTEVVILSRNPSAARPLDPGVRIVQWDGRTAEGWGDLANGAEAIVNLAGASIGIPPIPWWLPGRRQAIRASRANAGRAVVEAIEKAAVKPRVLIQSSGINYYGLRGDHTVTEEGSAASDFAASVCVDWEASTAEVESLGVRRAVIRTAPVLTPTGGILAWLKLPFRMFVGGPLGNGKQWLSWIHIADQVGAIRFLIEKVDLSGTFDLSAPNPVTNAEFGRLVARASHRPYWLPTPALALSLVFGELGRVMILGSLRVLPARLLSAGFTFRFPDVPGAVQDLIG
ncbi:MAG: TIGR01777 family oxidoreductase [Chloroflexi bacterium]|nr:TIGR01777 family oxidoreductase [Chloroflexota bacterium]